MEKQNLELKEVAKILMFSNIELFIKNSPPSVWCNPEILSKKYLNDSLKKWFSNPLKRNELFIELWKNNYLKEIKNCKIKKIKEKFNQKENIVCIDNKDILYLSDKGLLNILIYKGKKNYLSYNSNSLVDMVLAEYSALDELKEKINQF